MAFLSRPILLAVLLAASSASLDALVPTDDGILLVEDAQVSVQVDPEAGAILGKVLLTLRNGTGRELAVVDLKIPSPYGTAAKVGVVWDRHEELPWRRLVPAEAPGEFRLQVPLSRPLGDGKTVIVGVSFEVHLRGREQDGTRVEGDSFVLMGSGWYPVPAAGEPVPQQVRLSVRLPKEWQVTTPPKARRKHRGVALWEYEVKYDGQAAGRVVFAARAPGPG